MRSSSALMGGGWERRPSQSGFTLTVRVLRYATASTNPMGASQTVRFPAQKTRTVEFRGLDDLEAY